jgi:hypothetical protein
VSASRVPRTALDRLGEVSRAYELAADEYRGIAIVAAEAEAAHKAARAKAILREKAREDARMSHAEAETRAEADDTVAGLYLERLTKAAMADSHREKLRQLREQVATGRTAVTSDREVDRLHAQGLTGAA